MNKNNRFLFINKKYLATFVLTALFGGNVAAQNVTGDTIYHFNPMETLTHTRSIIPNEPHKPKNPVVKFSNPEDALYVELESFTHATTDNLHTVFCPLVVVKPFVRIHDKLTIGATTTQMIQNYFGPQMTSITHDMYATVALRTSVGTFDVKYGKFSALNYSPKFSKVMPISHYFINAKTLNTGHYFPRAIIATYTVQEISVSGGYAEYTPGMAFHGDGYVVFVMQQNLGESLQVGGMLITNQKDVIGNLQLTCDLCYNMSVLLQVVNLGERPAFFGTYQYKLKDNVASIAINGFVQSQDGVMGGTIGIYHKSGAYFAAGAVKHEPMYKNADGTPNEKFDKFTPSIELGINCAVFPKRSK